MLVGVQDLRASLVQRRFRGQEETKDFDDGAYAFVVTVNHVWVLVGFRARRCSRRVSSSSVQERDRRQEGHSLAFWYFSVGGGSSFGLCDSPMDPVFITGQAGASSSMPANLF